MHKFYEKSLTIDLIHNLLYNYWLPTYDTVLPGDYIHEGFLYVYLDSIIKCTQSGYIGGKYILTVNKVDTRYKAAKLDIIYKYELGNRYRKYTDNYIATSMNYTSDTHERLGKFIQTYSDLTGINLKPYYNCNSNRFIDFLYLASTTSESGEQGYQIFDYRSTKHKVLVIPIRFNRTYTVALDCPGLVLMCPIFLSHLRKLILKHTNSEDEDLTSNFLSLTNQIYAFPSMSYSKPEYITINCTNEVADKYYQYLKNLYLLILVPNFNDSSVTVLEGKYKPNFGSFNEVYTDSFGSSANKIVTPKTYIDINEMATKTQYALNKVLPCNPSLLQFNVKALIPFANTLVQYLFDNVIDYTWNLDTNIADMQSALPNVAYKSLPEGIWTNTFRTKLFEYVLSAENSKHLDISGNVDREAERLLLAQDYNY